MGLKAALRKTSYAAMVAFVKPGTDIEKSTRNTENATFQEGAIRGS
jgi:hypothetical protein